MNEIYVLIFADASTSQLPPPSSLPPKDKKSGSWEAEEKLQGRLIANKFFGFWAIFSWREEQVHALAIKTTHIFFQKSKFVMVGFFFLKGAEGGYYT